VHSFTHQSLTQPDKIAIAPNGHIFVVDKAQKVPIAFDAGN